MFVLDPVNAVTSVSFYGKIRQQSGLRSACYLLYVCLLFAVAGTVAMRVQLGHEVNATFDWLESVTPEFQFADGKVTSDQKAPLVLHHPQFKEIVIIVDTTR